MNHILAVCDAEETYASGLVNYFNIKEGFPFQTRYFSTLDKWKEFLSKQKVEVALISESFYKECQDLNMVDKVILLKEDSQQTFDHLESVWKYQSCEIMIKEILAVLAKEPGRHCHIARKRNLKVIGFYSPIKRNMQTSLALTMGQLLAKRAKTLYMNLETHSGLDKLMNRNFSKDLTDLLYYMQNGKNGISYYLQSITEQINGLDILPPMQCPMDLISILPKEWLQLFYEMEVCTEYDYLLLDLSDGIQGLFDILRNCDRIYMVTAQDGIAIAKIDQYEKMLNQCKFEDIMEKTSKCSVPQIEYLPKLVERLTMTELADVAKEYLKEDFYAK